MLNFIQFPHVTIENVVTTFTNYSRWLLFGLLTRTRAKETDCESLTILSGVVTRLRRKCLIQLYLKKLNYKLLNVFDIIMTIYHVVIC